MKEFYEKLKNDPQFVAEFSEYMHGEEPQIREGSVKIGQELNKFMSNAVKGFAEKKGMTLSSDPATDQQLAEYCTASAKELNNMIMKQFTNYAG